MNAKQWLQRARDYKKTLVKILKKEKYRGGVMICKHNTILSIKNTETNKIEFIIDTKKDRGMIMFSELNENFAVPRYEPSVAREWLAEELTWNRKDLSFEDKKFSDEWESKRVKYTLGERELAEHFKEYLRDQIEMCQHIGRTMIEKSIKDL